MSPEDREFEADDEEMQEAMEACKHPGFDGFKEYAQDNGIGDHSSGLTWQLGHPADWLPHWNLFVAGFDCGQDVLNESFDPDDRN